VTRTDRNDFDTVAVCPPGIEPLLDAELAALGVRRRRVVRGGVEAPMRQRQLYAANLWLRTATRVLVRVDTFGAGTFDELTRNAAVVDWRRWIPEGAAVNFRVTSHRSKLDHTVAIAERLATAAGAELVGAADRRDDESVDTGDDVARFVVRLDRNQCTLSADSSGEPLYHRGWRRAVAKAPLRPTLAASMLAAVGWPGPGATSGRVMFADPFCGSGTLPIEAALAATGRPPSVGRPFAFMEWDDFAAGTWASVTAHPDPDGQPDPVIVAADRDAGAVAATEDNAGRAGVDDLIGATCASVSAFAPPPGPPPGDDDVAWIVTNPPWGGRLEGGGDLRDLYATFGRVVRERFTGWRVAMLVTDRHLAAHTGLSLTHAFHTTAGGIGVQLLVTDPIGATRAVSRRRRAPDGSTKPRRGSQTPM
jgi:putative N6-adenine-specific DNA methylase